MSQLDFYFDYACPWCYIGAKAVRELAAEGVKTTYHVWKMPENVTTPPPKPEGYSDQAKARLKELSAELNITVATPVQRETIPALLATKIAQDMNKAEKFVEATFRAHWADKKDISNRGVLLEIASEAGLDTDAFGEAFDREAGKSAYEQDLKQAVEMEITTIPSYLNAEKRILIHHFADMPTLEALRELAT